MSYSKRKEDNWKQLMEFESRWRLLGNCLKFQFLVEEGKINLGFLVIEGKTIS